MPTPDRLEEIKRIRNCVPFIDNGAGVPETQAAIDELIADNAALREAVRVLGGRVRMSVQSVHAVLGKAGETWEHFITDDVLANPIASAAVRAAKEQA